MMTWFIFFINNCSDDFKNAILHPDVYFNKSGFKLNESNFSEKFINFELKIKSSAMSF